MNENTKKLLVSTKLTLRDVCNLPSHFLFAYDNNVDREKRKNFFINLVLSLSSCFSQLELNRTRNAPYSSDDLMPSF